MLPPHTILFGGRYVIQTQLGAGIMAEVYLATDTVKQVDVALKLLRPDLALDPTFEEYFRREARVMQQLQHPNIVRFYEPMRDGELLFLVLDYIDGPNLQKYLFSNKLLPIADALHIAQALATALDYAHASGVIHRDLKPSNVLLAFNGAILLSDFGVARVAGATTTTTGMVGSPAYMAPEQIKGATLTRAADQYSLAVLLWELIASRRPFVGASAGLTGATLGERVLEEHLSHPPPTGVLPKGLDAPLRKALNKNASDRFPSCTALVQQLMAGSDTAPTTPQEWQRKIQAPQRPPPLPPPQPPSPPRPDWVRRLQAALGGLFAFLRTNKLAAGFAIITVAMFSVALLSPARTRWAIRQRVAQFVTSRSAGEHIYLWPDGTLYDGGWQDNKRNGEGTLTLPAGIKYVGAFKADLFNGQGTITYADGTTYTGAWMNNIRNAQGTITLADGTTYTGEFKNDTQNGQGTMTFPDGTKLSGEWDDSEVLP
jgi:serine/threonine protein kinase